jgi:hypothetical protein
MRTDVQILKLQQDGLALLPDAIGLEPNGLLGKRGLEKVLILVRGIGQDEVFERPRDV